MVKSKERDGQAIAGVIGGMGPDATVELMRRVIAATPAKDDIDHVRMLVDNNPKVPSRIRALLEGGGESPGPVLMEMAQGLERAGATFLVMPCNTAHYYWHTIAQAVDVPVWNLVKLTLQRAVTRHRASRIGMLASPALRQVQVYESVCHMFQTSLVYPERNDVLLNPIRAVKAGCFGRAEASIVNTALRELAEAGAEVIVLGCTEFSLVSHRLTAEGPIIDSLQVMTDEIVAHAA